MKILLLIPVLLLCVLSASAQATKRKMIDTADNKPTSSPTMFRMSFDDLFRQNADASYSPKIPLMINGEMVGTGTKVANGVRYGGIDISQNLQHDAMVDTAKGVVIIRRFVQ